MVALVLSVPERIAANIEAGSSLPLLAGVLTFAGITFGVPYSCAHGFEAW
jgi:hypothetical protein